MNRSLTSFADPLNVVVVGASGGIGQALIKLLLANKQVQSVMGLSRQSHHLAMDHPKYQHYVMDYNDEATIVSAANQLAQPLDMVIVATGFLHDENIRPEGALKQLSSDAMMKNLWLNTIGPSLVAKYFIPKMRTQHKAVFAALSARVGSISDNRLGGWYAYRASKAALNMVIRTLSIELKRHQKQVIAVGLHPGTVDTPLSQPFQRNVKPEKLFTSEFSAQCLLNVMNQLTTDDSGYCFAWDGRRVPE